MTDTPLDAAHAALDGDDAAQLRFFERLAGSELFLLLRNDPDGDRIDPDVFEVSGARYVLVFDREERLTDFVGRPAPYAGLSGRALAAMLAGHGIGLGLHFDVAPSSMLIPSEAVDWLHGILGQRPAEVRDRPSAIAAPHGLSERFLAALDARLAAAEGLARMAYLVSATYPPGRPGHLLAFIDASSGAEAALAQTAGEALSFSGIEAAELDIGFFAATDPMAARLAKVGLRFDLPQPKPSPQPRPPGTDPDTPREMR